MGSVRRNPDGTKWRYNPDALFRAHRHYALRSKQKLVLWMRVLRDQVAVTKLGRHTGKVPLPTAVAPQQEEAMAPLRHFLSR